MASETPVLEGHPAGTTFPRPAEASAPPRVKTRVLLPALASAALLWACFFPLALGWLAWVALVPLLTLVRTDARPRRLYFAAWVAGLAFFYPAIQWMRVADYRMYATWAMLATYCSLYLPVTIWLLRRLDRGTPLPLVVTVPLVWCGLEFLRSFLLTGFAWYYLAHTQHTVLPLIQVADLGGAYTVSLLVAAVNAGLFEVLFTWPQFRLFFGLKADAAGLSRRALAVQFAALAVLLAGAVGYGYWRLGQDTFAAGPRVALLQSNLDQRLRINASLNETDKAIVRDTCAELCRRASQQQPPPDLVVWPETSFYGEWFDLDPAIPRDQVSPRFAEMMHAAQEPALDVARANGVNVLLGVNSVTRHWEPRLTRFNTALLVRPDGRVGGRYDKIHRIPFGEYVPLRDVLPFMERFAPYDFVYSIHPGDHLTRFVLGTYHFGVLICYEDTDPFMARQYAMPGADGPPVHFLLNISNDGWFDGTSEHDEHLAICRFRAVEARRAVARAVNMGISAVIDGNGRVLAPEQAASTGGLTFWQVNPAAAGPTLPVAEWGRFKKTQGILTAAIPIDDRVSLYALWGDWLGWGCVLLVAGGLVWGTVRRFLTPTPERGCGH
jgi:apolipoprotein N-acyltransferase